MIPFVADPKEAGNTNIDKAVPLPEVLPKECFRSRSRRSFGFQSGK